MLAFETESGAAPALGDALIGTRDGTGSVGSDRPTDRVFAEGVVIDEWSGGGLRVLWPEAVEPGETVRLGDSGETGSVVAVRPQTAGVNEVVIARAGSDLVSVVEWGENRPRRQWTSGATATTDQLVLVSPEPLRLAGLAETLATSPGTTPTDDPKAKSPSEPRTAQSAAELALVLLNNKSASAAMIVVLDGTVRQPEAMLVAGVAAWHGVTTVSISANSTPDRAAIQRLAAQVNPAVTATRSVPTWR